MSDLRGILTDIYQERGQLTPQDVVDEARPQESPLHHRFEWDDAIAGEAYRVSQARRLITSVRIEYSQPDSDERKSVRAFASVRLAGTTDRRGYAPTRELIENPVTRTVLLQSLIRAVSDLRRTYGHLAEFSEIVAAALMPPEQQAS